MADWSPPYSYVTYEDVSSSTGPFSYAGFLVFDDDIVAEKNQIEVYVDGTLQTLDTDYTVDPTNDEITFLSPVTADLIRIQRNTKKDARYVDFEDASVLTEADLDLDANQVFFIAQEAYDLAYDSMHLGNDGRWEGRGIEIRRIADATQDTSAPSWGQVKALIGDGNNVTLGSAFAYKREGDGVTKTFDLADDTYLLNGTAEDVHIASKWNLIVRVNGVVVSPDSTTPDPNGYFTLSGTEITLSFTPGKGEYIEVIWLPGTIQALYGDCVVDTDAICPRAVTGPKIALGAIDTEHLTAGCVGTAQLENGCVNGNKLAALAVDSQHIAPQAVTSAKVVVGLNADPTLVDLKTTNNWDIDDVVWEDNSNTSFLASSVRLCWVSVVMEKTTEDGNRVYALEVSENQNFTGTVYEMSRIKMTQSEKGILNLQGWVPAGHYWRVRRVSGSSANNNNITLVAVTQMSLKH